MATALAYQTTVEDEAAAADELKSKLSDRKWRLNHLYMIVNEKGQKIRFLMNLVQQVLYLKMWYLTIILKSRQHGITTFICLFFLDYCFFNSNVSACIIAHNREDAEDFFNKKIRFAYDHLPEALKAANPAMSESVRQLSFANGSSIRVTTSGRSGTFQLLHVSEFGKICAKYPEKAREIKTGSLLTVHPGQIVFIESTADGREGDFFDFCETAQKKKADGTLLSQLDWRFFFFPWYYNALNQIEPKGVEILPRLVTYFNRVEIENAITLSLHQKAWYVKREATLGVEDMRRENPSTPQEAFEVSIQGAYYNRQLFNLRKNKQICSVPHRDSLTVDTWWDLGFNDSNVIWFTQDVGREIHIIDYYENSGESMAHYINYLHDKPYRYGSHTAPHDIAVREYSTGISRIKAAANLGLYFQVAPKTTIETGIDAVRNILSICWFDREKTDAGVKALEAYRKEWNEHLGCYRKQPLHNWASHAADGFRVFAMAHKFDKRVSVQSDQSRIRTEASKKLLKV